MHACVCFASNGSCVLQLLPRVGSKLDGAFPFRRGASIDSQCILSRLMYNTVCRVAQRYLANYTDSMLDSQKAEIDEPLEILFRQSSHRALRDPSGGIRERGKTITWIPFVRRSINPSADVISHVTSLFFESVFGSHVFPSISTPHVGSL